MAYDDALASRIRDLLAGEDGVTEQEMFGGLAFLVNGNMAVAASGQGGILVRVDPAESAQLVETMLLNRITLHECRHTYASLLMAAGYTIKELMEFMGHADLQMVNRYVKLLPQPGEDNAAQRLNDYLRRASGEQS